MRITVPFQKMPADAPLQVMPLAELASDLSLQPHRHNFYMLLWVTKGQGLHRVNYRDFDLLPGRVFLMHEGHIHQVLDHPEEAWVVLFQPVIFREFLNLYKRQEQAGLFDYFSRLPFVDLDEGMIKIFVALLELLSDESRHSTYGPVALHYLSVLLLKANGLAYRQESVNFLQAEQLRRLKGLVDRHYKLERKAIFYSGQLGLSSRKLNELCRRTMGKTVEDLIIDRLLSEMERYLGGSDMLMKEIVRELRFIDHSHFAYFFRSRKGLSPSAFRKKAQQQAKKSI